MNLHTCSSHRVITVTLRRSQCSALHAMAFAKSFTFKSTEVEASNKSSYRTLCVWYDVIGAICVCACRLSAAVTPQRFTDSSQLRSQRRRQCEISAVSHGTIRDSCDKWCTTRHSTQAWSAACQTAFNRSSDTPSIALRDSETRNEMLFPSMGHVRECLQSARVILHLLKTSCAVLTIFGLCDWRLRLPLNCLRNSQEGDRKAHCSALVSKNKSEVTIRRLESRRKDTQSVIDQGQGAYIILDLQSHS